MSFTVGQISAFTGVTIKTLHHYDRIGLLSPRGRTDSGYRLYEEPDIERLQQILFYRELGFGLDEIRSILDDPSAHTMEHLRNQRTPY